MLAGDSWVIDGGYWGKIGDLVLAGADLVVWIDLTLRGAVWGRGALISYAIRAHFRPDLIRGGYPGTGSCGSAPRPRWTGSQRRRRDLNSATQAAARSPIQIGVRIT